MGQRYYRYWFQILQQQTAYGQKLGYNRCHDGSFVLRHQADDIALPRDYLQVDCRLNSRTATNVVEQFASYMAK